jgi:hypothetical protein
MPRPPSVLCVIGVATLLLAGCTSPDEPGETGPSATSAAESSTEPSASPSPSPSPSQEPEPVVVAPQRPAAMDDDGYQGAAAAAEYFLELDDYIMKTNDTAEWEAMSHEKCTTCAARLHQAQNIAKNADVFEGGKVSTRILHSYEQDGPTGIWPIDVEISVAPVSITDSAGKVLYSAKKSVAKERIEVVREDDRWIIVNIADVEETARQAK